MAGICILAVLLGRESYSTNREMSHLMCVVMSGVL